MLTRLATACDGVQQGLEGARSTSAEAEAAMGCADAAFRRRGALPAAPAQPPRLAKPWRAMCAEEQRAYLVAVRDHAGEGELYERRLQRTGRAVVALFDPGMAAAMHAYAWTADPKRSGSVVARPVGKRGRTCLAALTARHLLLGGEEVPHRIMALSFADGCPANCLASNLELKPRRGAEDEFADFVVLYAPKLWRPAELAALGPDAADGAVALAAAEREARAALRRLYGLAGAARVAELQREVAAAVGAQ